MLLRKDLLWCRFLLMKITWYENVDSSTPSIQTLYHNTNHSEVTYFSIGNIWSLLLLLWLVFCPLFRLHEVSLVFVLMLHTRSSQGHSQFSNCASTNAASIHFPMFSQYVCQHVEREMLSTLFCLYALYMWAAYGRDYVVFEV